MLLRRYTSDWVLNFEKIKAVLETGLSGISHRIEHVGSTAVAGLDAKDIIDIDIVYEDSSQFEQIKMALEKMGYHHNGDQGIPQREVFKRIQGDSHPVLDGIRHHLYVCLSGSRALGEHLIFRDCLRKDPEARQEYQSIKYSLAAQANQDKDHYARLKELKVGSFIAQILLKHSA